MITYFLAPLVFVGLAIAILFVYTLPQYEVFERKTAERVAYQEVLGQGQEILDLKASVAERYRRFSQVERDKLYEMLPADRDIIGTMARVDAIAARTGVTLVSLSEAEGNARNDNDPRSLNAVGLSYEVTANYQSFLAFLREIERSLRIIDIHELSFSAPEGAADIMEFSIRANTYWLGE
jgi:Tfp pilus assembly protein PilO